MSWLSNIVNNAAGWGGEDPVAVQQRQAEAERQRQAAAQAAAAQADAVASATGSAPTAAPVPVGGPEDALSRLNAALGPGFESQYLPDTLDDPFITSAVGAGRSKADAFIANMLKRGTLSESGRAGAVKALDVQTPGVQTRLNELSNTILAADRNRLTDFANTKRAAAQQTPLGTTFDPGPSVGEIASTGQGYASTFGDRFNAGLPAGDLFDTSGLAGAGGGVAGPQNLQFDPYAQEGGSLSTGLDQGTSTPQKKRRTAVF